MFNRPNKLDDRISQLGDNVKPQGHALHFLERLHRADENASRLALDLYHKPEALRFVLDWVKMPGEFTRAAVSLCADDKGPFLVAELDGKFVTCLGRDMGIDGLFFINHSRLLALLVRYGEIADSAAHAQALKSEDLLGSVIGRLETAGMTYTREDLLSIRPLQPLLVYETFRALVEGSLRVTGASSVLSRKHVRNKVDDETAKLFWNEMFSTAHNIVLLGLNGTRGLEPILESEEHTDVLWDALVSTMWMNTVFHASRVIWLLGRLGKKLRRRLERALWHPVHEMDWLLGLLGTAVSMLRQSSSVESATDMLLKLRRKIPNYSPPVTGWIVKYCDDEFFRRLISILTDPHTVIEKYTVPSMQAMLHEELTACKVPAPYDYANPEDIPLDIALSGTVGVAVDFMNDPRKPAALLPLLPVLASAEAEDLYMPRALAEHIALPWSPECTRTILEREKEMWKVPAAKTAKAAGRNDPCPCGSGKKYKKCCFGKPRPRGMLPK